VRVDDACIGGHRLTRLEDQYVAGHDLVRRNRALLAVTQDGGFARGQLAQAGHRAFGLAFGGEADDAVRPEDGRDRCGITVRTHGERRDAGSAEQRDR
jgi:hypothetical protein